MKIKAGDKIKIPEYVMGHRTGDWNEFEVVEYRGCLGVFGSGQAKEAGHLTPLCELYEAGPESEEKYISNYGSYTSNMIPAFILMAS